METNASGVFHHYIWEFTCSYALLGHLKTPFRFFSNRDYGEYVRIWAEVTVACFTVLS
jgi:hypothetical protein